MIFKHSIVLSLLSIIGFNAIAADKLGYFRSPTLHENTIVFTAEGDLWQAYTNVGIAKRLTTHTSEEIMASLSPDGKHIAYIANYEGNFEAYLIATSGGTPIRLTFEQSRVRVQGWTADGQVLYATDSGFGPANNWTLKTVHPSTLQITSLPLADAVEGTIDEQGKYLYFTRFGLQVTGDNSKVYRGGAQGQLWRYKLGSNEEAKWLSKDHQASVREPMLYQQRLYFISDASGSDNLWSMNLDGSDSKQLTQHKEWEIRLASINNHIIVFQLGADIKQYDINSAQETFINLQLSSDYTERQERWLNNPLKYFNNADLANNSDKTVITARGKLAVAGLNNSRLIEIPTPASSRTRSAVISSDGQWVYAINDSTGENEIWRYSADGSGKSKRLTNNGSSFRWNLALSPDNKFIAHDDRDGNLWLLDLNSVKNKKIASSGSGFSAFDQIIWSKDSKYIAFAGYQQQQERSSISLYSLLSGKQQQLTSDKYESFWPTFSSDGQWLYFLSDRHFQSNPTSPWGDRNMGPAFDKRTQIFAYPLAENAQFVFEKPNELNQNIEKESAKNSKDGSKKNKPNIKPIWSSITENLYQVPVPSGNYSHLMANKNGLYLLNENGKDKDLSYIKFDNLNPKITTFTTKVLGFELAENGKKLLIGKKSGSNVSLYIFPAGETAPKDVNKGKVNSKHWQMAFSPMDEWQQMFEDAWLMHREFLFDQNMRGLDWAATKLKYQPLVDRITSRSELNDIFAQMMGELNALHSQVRGGDFPTIANQVQGSSLGARYEQTKQGVKITSIYKTDKELPNQAAPLAKAGVNANAGDIISAINNQPIQTLVQLHKALRNQASKQVLLTLKRGSQTIKNVVTPMTSRQDANKRYLDWVYHNNTTVQKIDKAELGYLHMNAMTSNDINNFAREFYANIHKDGLIIDVRRNRGGNIDSWLIEKMLRKVWMFWQERDSTASSNMQQTFQGHLVVLTDQLTYSDGETFAAAVKALGLAPLIGKQTTGAGVWLTGRNRLTDGGMARVAELPQFALDGTWVVEGIGVTPDIDVDNLPYATYQGKDAQLEAGINYLLNKLEQQPIKTLQKTPLPIKGPAKDVKALK